MRFSEISQCPFCGCIKFYTTISVSGFAVVHRSFNSEIVEEDDIACGMRVKRETSAYCEECREYLGDIKRDILSNDAEKMFLENINET